MRYGKALGNIGPEVQGEVRVQDMEGVSKEI